MITPPCLTHSVQVGLKFDIFPFLLFHFPCYYQTVEAPLFVLNHGSVVTAEPGVVPVDLGRLLQPSLCLWRWQHRVSFPSRRPELASWRHRGYASNPLPASSGRS